MIKTSTVSSCSSTADTYKNCAKCGKGFKIGTNEDYSVKIKKKLGGISKIVCCCSHANMAASDKGISPGFLPQWGAAGRPPPEAVCPPPKTFTPP